VWRVEVVICRRGVCFATSVIAERWKSLECVLGLEYRQSQMAVGELTVTAFDCERAIGCLCVNAICSRPSMEQWLA
jgi:hypothetical protein